MKIKSISGLFIAAIIFNGCSFKPNLPDKEIKFESQIEKTNISDKWWVEFNDDNLNKFIQQVLTNNSDLALALNNIDIARTSLGLSKLELLPNITYSTGIQRRNNPPIDSNHNDSYSASFILNYELDLWGRVRNSIGANKSKFKSTQYDYETAKLTLISTAASTYFRLKSLKKQEEILTKTLNTYETSLRLRKSQLNSGAISPIVFYQTQSQVDSAKTSLAKTQDAIASINSAIMLLSGSNFNDIFKSSISVSNQDNNIPIVPQNLSSDILLKRPDVAAALENLKAANFAIGVARANYFPKISITGVLGYANPELDNLFNKMGESWNIAGSLAGTLLDFGRIYKNVELATLQQKSAFLQYDKTLKNTFSEVRYALEARKYLQEQLNNATNLVKTQKKVYQLAQNRYNQGYSDFLELLDAQRNLLSAQLNQTQAEYENINSIINIYKTFGGGFEIKEKEDIKLLSNSI